MIKFPNEVILKGKKARDLFGWLLSRCYHLWLAIVVVAFIKMHKKYIKDTKHFLIFLAICIPMCYVWQWILTQSHGVFPAWFFWSTNILFNFPILGMTFEDIVLFHPFGQIFGYIFLVLFGVFEIKGAPQKNTEIASIIFPVIFIAVSIPALFLDFSSALSYLMFAVGGIMMILVNIREINIVQFIKFFVIITIMSILMDWSCVTLPIWLGYPEAQGWAYRNGNQFSQYLSSKSWSWIFRNEPISILVVYPWSYMLWMTGLFVSLKKVLRGSNA